MVFKPRWSWRAVIILVPLFGLLVLAFLLPFALDWPRIIASGLILPLGALGCVLLCAALLPFPIFFTESWEITNGRLIHTIWFHEKRIHAISEIDAFASTTLRSGPPSWFLFGINPKWLTVKGKKVDRMLFPFLYAEPDWERFKAELKSINPNIRFGYSLV